MEVLQSQKLWVTLTREVSILGHEGAGTWLSTLTFPLSAWKSARPSFRSWSVRRAEWTVPWRLWHKEEKTVLGADGGGCVPRADGQGPALCSLHSVIRLCLLPDPLALPLHSGFSTLKCFYMEDSNLSRPLLHIALSSPWP